MPNSMIEGADQFVSAALKAFAENLRFIRDRRQMTYRELADRSGMTERNAYQIVNGKQGANVKTIAQLAQALHIPTADLFLEPDRFERKYAKAKPLAPLSVSVNGVKRTKPRSLPDLLERIPA